VSSPVRPSTTVAIRPEDVVVPQAGVGGERLGDRGRVGQAGGLHDDAAELGQEHALAALPEVQEGVAEFRADGAANTAGGEQDGLGVDGLDEQVVEADGAELVHEHGRVGQPRVA
jgi:hypothetical protein